jgi:hypothetical protein
MLKARKFKAETLEKIRAGLKDDCWAPGSGCDCTKAGANGVDNFEDWVDNMDDQDPPSWG